MNKYVVMAGDLRTPVTLQKAAINTDAGGAQKASWSNFTSNPNVWAKWSNQQGAESVDAGAAKIAGQTATVVIRYRSEMDATCAVVNGSYTWRVLSVDNIQNRNEYMELKVELVKGTV